MVQLVEHLFLTIFNCTIFSLLYTSVDKYILITIFIFPHGLIIHIACMRVRKKLVSLTYQTTSSISDLFQSFLSPSEMTVLA
jgi:hypothetical protein